MEKKKVQVILFHGLYPKINKRDTNTTLKAVYHPDEINKMDPCTTPYILL